MNTEYTLAEVNYHSSDGDRWLVFNGEVYDVSEFKHPGGKDAIDRNSGKDATQAMSEVQKHQEHLDGFQKYLDKLKIGTLKSE